jgi:hypothetical protein
MFQPKNLDLTVAAHLARKMKGCKLATLLEIQSRVSGDMGDLAEESDTAN